VGNHDTLGGEVNTLNVAIKEGHSAQELTDRIDNMGDV